MAAGHGLAASVAMAVAFWLARVFSLPLSLPLSLSLLPPAKPPARGGASTRGLASRSRSRSRSVRSGGLLRPALLLLWTAHLLGPAAADCECGYLSSVGVGVGGDDDGNVADGTAALFTDLLETDFTRVRRIADDPDWIRQAFNLTSERARGDYGEMFAVDNVFTYHGDHGGGGAGGGEEEEEEEGWGGDDESSGLKLVVRSDIVDGMVPVAEIDTRRLDIFRGTFRASMKLSAIPGTCAAFFWYFNDTQEIDMEFLSSEFNRDNGSFPVNLVLQSREAAMAGYDAAKTGNFVKANLPFDPTGGFHEYRIDYLPGRVVFYADGHRLAEMDGPAVPTTAGLLILQHWSNGNRFWSGGPPAEDSALTVRYVKAYFNSSEPRRRRDWQARCRDPRVPGAVCRIPDVTPADSSAADWFFKDQRNMTNNQTGSGESDGAALDRPWWPAMGLVLLVGLWTAAL